MGNASSTANRPTSGAQASQDSPARTSSRRSRSTAPPSTQAPTASPRSPSSPAPSDAQGQSAATPTQQHRLPHRSLRTKKKSLELPDLAVPTTPYRRPGGSAPIAIPTKPGAPPPSGSPRIKSIPSVAPMAAADVIIPNSVAYNAGAAPGTTYRGNHHMRGAPIQYNSTRSFAGRGGEHRPQQPISFAQRGHPHGGFVPEDVHSSIPLALRKAELEHEDEEEREGGKLAHKRSTDEKRPAQVCIVWRGAGKNVMLLRAGDNNWKGKQAMEFDEDSGTWSTWVPLMPGTHHIRFLVDGVLSTAEDLPTAVDDNGSLANYVAVPISGHTPPSATLHPTPREQIPQAGTGASFFADNDTSSNENAPWTDKVPWQLECAAEEEEHWLAHTHAHVVSGGRNQSAPPPPQHPQAPSLPRHLEKLILNQRPPGMGRQHVSPSGRSAQGGLLQTAVTNAAMGSSGSSGRGLHSGQLPVTTASGTNLSSSSSGGAVTNGGQGGSCAAPMNNHREGYTKLVDSQGLADDGSVLPVPSHVVLHHLGTSAIRNGVLAVADTIRYKKKYITTIYYKPT